MSGYSDRVMASRLEQLMKEDGLSRAEFAARIGSTASQVGQWIRGERSPSIAALFTIANEFGVTMDWICGRSKIQLAPGPGVTTEQMAVINALFNLFEKQNVDAGMPDLSKVVNEEP